MKWKATSTIAVFIAAAAAVIAIATAADWTVLNIHTSAGISFYSNMRKSEKKN